LQLAAEGDEQQLLLREADAAELEFSLCLRLKNQPAAAQDEQQEQAAQQLQGGLFGAKLGSASTPGEALCARHSFLQPAASGCLSGNYLKAAQPKAFDARSAGNS
jgi:hypothetical protein